MNINDIFTVIVDAAKDIGPVGTAAAVMKGAASAAGKTAFDALKTWVTDKLGSNNTVTQQLTALQANPHDAAVQQQLLSSLNQHAAQLNDPALAQIVQLLQQTANTASHNQGGLNIGSQQAEKIVNIGSVHNLTL